jgi:hypothetical protein
MLEVRTAIEINAAPEQVWKHVLALPDLAGPTEWFFIEGSGPGAIRYCEFSTGAFVEPIEEWDEARLLRFRVTKNPAPMKEWSPYPGVDPAHLSGYMISERGQFKLTPTRRPNIARRKHVVSPWPVAVDVLAVVVRRYHSSNSPSRVAAHRTTGRKLLLYSDFSSERARLDHWRNCPRRYFGAVSTAVTARSNASRASVARPADFRAQP